MHLVGILNNKIVQLHTQVFRFHSRDTYFGFKLVASILLIKYSSAQFKH